LDAPDEELSVAVGAEVGLSVCDTSLVCSSDARLSVATVCVYVAPFSWVDEVVNGVECSRVSCVFGVVEDPDVWFP
jgi:hypothetical protein